MHFTYMHFTKMHFTYMHFTLMQYLLIIVLHFMCINGRDLVVSGHLERVRGNAWSVSKNDFFSHRFVYAFVLDV